MNSIVSKPRPSTISSPAPRLAIGAAVTSLFALASLHPLSPEFDPAWRFGE